MSKPFQIFLLMVVTGLIAFAVLVPRFGNSPKQARRTAAQTQIATFGTALEAFKVDTGSYPQGANGLNDLIAKPPGATGWRGPYLKSESSLPRDPWGHAYLYICPGEHNSNEFDLISCGPDGLTGTEDDVKNWQ